jgi:taurine dioxygenase
MIAGTGHMSGGIEVRVSGQACGATVRNVDIRGGLDDTTVAEIRSAWLDHKVLSFPDQDLGDEDLERFARYFGPFGDDPFFESIDGHPHIAAIERRADETASLFADSWHSDWSFQQHPPDGTCLYSKTVPTIGGDTLFADQQAALEAMAPEMRKRIAGLTAIHSARSGYSPTGLYGDVDAADRSMRIRISDDAYATNTHSLIRTHPETGAETIYSTAGYIIGFESMTEDESAALLVELYGWQTRERFWYRHRWEPDMLVMWDNRCLLHKATGGYEGHERLLHRITIGFNPQYARG